VENIERRAKIMKIKELELAFAEINRLRKKSKMTTCEFCSELIKFDSDDYLELHYNLLTQKEKYFQPNLKMYFEFRVDKFKVQSFLKNKLKEISDNILKKDIKEILSNIEIYCKSLEEYKKWFVVLKKRGIFSFFDREKIDDERMDFVDSLGCSSFIEYHYELIKNKRSMDKDFWENIRANFDKHGEEGELFLLSKLDNNEDVDFHGEIIFLLGLIKGKHKDKILRYARLFAESPDNCTRDRAIIVLGWIGEVEDTEILRKHLLTDTNSKCRTWSASSFMQMWFNWHSEKIKEIAFKSFREALNIETDNNVITAIITAVKEISDKKFNISQSTLYNLDKKKIESVKTKLEKYLDNMIKV
jgi:hypothetical protein